MLKSLASRQNRCAAALFCFLLCMVAASALMAALGRPQEAGPAITPDSIAAALRDQMYRCGDSLEVTYTVVPEMFTDPMTGDAVSEDEVVYTWQTRYIRTPEYQYMEEETLRKNVLWTTTKRSYCRASGEYRALSFRVDSGETSGAVARAFPRSFFSQPGLLDPVDICLSLTPIQEVISQASIGAAMEAVDGHACYHLTVAVDKEGDRGFDVWVDPEIGFLPRRTESRLMPGGSIHRKVYFKGYRQVGDGVWFPEQMVVECYDNGAVWGRSTYQLRSIAIGKSFSAADLKVEFPSGIKVKNCETGEVAIQP